MRHLQDRRQCAGVAMAVAALLVPLAAGAAQTEYVVGPQDVLTITVWEEAELSGKFAVAADGTFTFPFVGRVKAGGCTVAEIEAALKTRLADGILRDPQLTVTVEQYRSQMIYVIGELRTPGSYPITGELTLIDILARAGSTTDRAGGLVIVTRPGPAGMMPEAITVDLDELMRGVLARNIRLHGGDTVFVPRADMCFVVGEVNQPGTYPIRSDTTILQAVALAGGLNANGTMKRIQVVRMVDGQRQERKAGAGDLVKPGDTIVVRERIF
jgi:polysaccharide export outer membrane protein